MIRMKLDVATSRVVYFSMDSEEVLTHTRETIDYDYPGELPEGMTLKNCWNWALRGNKLINTEKDKHKPKQDLLTHNKQEVKNFLMKRIMTIRNRSLSAFGGEYIFKNLVLDEIYLQHSPFIKEMARAADKDISVFIKDFLENTAKANDVLKITMINKVYYERLINLAESNEVLYKIRDEIQQRNLAIIQTE